MTPQYIEMASLLMEWGGLWFRDTGTRALFPLKGWFARLAPEGE
jgi:hypothetical protein